MAIIFENPKALEESISAVQLSTAQQAESKRVKHKLDSWIDTDKSGIIAYLGKFGSGKSSTLNGVHDLYVKSKSKKQQPIWLNFEAWRYSDRQQLWDGFVIEVIAKINDSTNHVRTAEAIDGYRGFFGWVRRNTIWVVPAFVLCFLIISAITWWVFYGRADVPTLMAKALLKYAVPLLLALLAVLGLSEILGKREPMRRIFQLETSLKASLQMIRQRPLIVVVEDVDRAGDEGITFLETLRSFLEKNYPSSSSCEASMIVIAPQDITYMSALNEDKVRGLDRGLKIYDESMHYGQSVICADDAIALMQAAGICNKYKNEFEATVTDSINRYKKQLSLRLLKFVLREVHEFADSQEECNPSVAYTFIIARYLVHSENNRKTDTVLNIFSEAAKRESITLGIGNGAITDVFRTLAKIAGVENPVRNCTVSYVTSHEINAEELETLLNNSINIKLEINERYLALLNV